MKKVIAVLTLMFTFSAIGFADIAHPDASKTKPSKSIDATLFIRLQGDAKEAKLIIPKNQVKALRASLDQLDDDDSNTAAVVGVSRTQTIVSGMFLSLALVFGGIWFARSGKDASRTGKTGAVAAVLFIVGAVTTLVFANAGPPPEARSITGKMFSQAVHIYKFGSGKIKLETSGDGDTVQLIVPDTKPPQNGEE